MLLFATLAVGLGGAAYPISPRPLRRLVEEAEFIVTARVLEADQGTRERALTPERRQWGGTSVVVLEIDGLLKGDPGVSTIEQVVHGGVACPAPARYAFGTRVLAFLDRGTEPGCFTTHARSYGAKTLGPAAMAVYQERIREQVAIEQMPADESRLALQVEWLVRCAEHHSTRWEGAYELAPAGDFMSHYERERSTPDFAGRLSGAQRDRLRDAFLAAGDFGAGERCLEELLRDEEDPRLLAWLVDQLRAHHREVEKESYSVASFLVERIARRDDRPEVLDLAASFESMRTYGKGGDDGPGRLRAVRELLALY